MRSGLCIFATSWAKILAGRLITAIPTTFEKCRKDFTQFATHKVLCVTGTLIARIVATKFFPVHSRGTYTAFDILELLRCLT